MRDLYLSLEHHQMIQEPEADVDMHIVRFWKRVGETTSKFRPLSQLAMALSLIPHSNAAAERVFSLIGNQLSDARKRMKKDTTLNNIMIVRCAELANNFIPSPDLIKKAKSATRVSLL